MGKRTKTQFERSAADYYVTPKAAFLPLVPFLDPVNKGYFFEPCAGNGAIIDLAESAAMECIYALDKNPQASRVEAGDAMEVDFRKKLEKWGHNIEFITNLPWTRCEMLSILSKLIIVDGFGGWMLAPADLFFTEQERAATKGRKKYNIPVMDTKKLSQYCDKIVAVGRVCWFPDENGKGKKGYDSCAWYHFTSGSRIKHGAPVFYPLGTMPSDFPSYHSILTLPSNYKPVWVEEENKGELVVVKNPILVQDEKPMGMVEAMKMFAKGLGYSVDDLKVAAKRLKRL